MRIPWRSTIGIVTVSCVGLGYITVLNNTEEEKKNKREKSALHCISKRFPTRKKSHSMRRKMKRNGEKWKEAEERGGEKGH
jgi:hypothetical protein